MVHCLDCGVHYIQQSLFSISGKISYAFYLLLINEYQVFLSEPNLLDELSKESLHDVIWDYTIGTYLIESNAFGPAFFLKHKELLNIFQFEKLVKNKLVFHRLIVNLKQTRQGASLLKIIIKRSEQTANQITADQFKALLESIDSKKMIFETQKVDDKLPSNTQHNTIMNHPHATHFCIEMIQKKVTIKKGSNKSKNMFLLRYVLSNKDNQLNQLHNKPLDILHVMQREENQANPDVDTMKCLSMKVAEKEITVKSDSICLDKLNSINLLINNQIKPLNLMMYFKGEMAFIPLQIIKSNFFSIKKDLLEIIKKFIPLLENKKDTSQLQKTIMDYLFFLENNTNDIITANWSEDAVDVLKLCLTTIVNNPVLTANKQNIRYTLSLSRAVTLSLLLLSLRQRKNNGNHITENEKENFNTFFKDKIIAAYGQNELYSYQFEMAAKVIDTICSITHSSWQEKNNQSDWFNLENTLFQPSKNQTIKNLLNIKSRSGFANKKSHDMHHIIDIIFFSQICKQWMLNAKKVSVKISQYEYNKQLICLFELLEHKQKDYSQAQQIEMLVGVMNNFTEMLVSPDLNNEAKKLILNKLFFYLTSDTFNKQQTYHLKHSVLLQYLNTLVHYQKNNSSELCSYLSEDVLIYMGEQFSHYHVIFTDKRQAELKVLYQQVIQLWQLAIVSKAHTYLQLLNSDNDSIPPNVFYHAIHLLYESHCLLLKTKIAIEIKSFNPNELLTPKYLLAIAENLTRSKYYLHGFLFNITAILQLLSDKKTDVNQPLALLIQCQLLLNKDKQQEGTLSFFQKQSPWMRLFTAFINKLKPLIHNISKDLVERYLYPLLSKLINWQHPNGNALFYLLKQQFEQVNSGAEKNPFSLMFKSLQDIQSSNWSQRINSLGKNIIKTKIKKAKYPLLYRSNGDIIEINDNDVLNQLFYKDKNFTGHKDYEKYAHHEVNYLAGDMQLFFKKNADFPLQEISARILWQLLTGESVKAELCVIVPPKTAAHYLLVSERIEGPSLHEAKDADTNKLFLAQKQGIDTLDEKNFAWLSIFSLLTNQGDLTADNLIVTEDKDTGKHHLTIIDGDRIWYDTVNVSANELKALVKNILYCLPQMERAYTQTFKQQLATLDIDFILEQWLIACNNLHKRYHTFFENNKKVFKDISARHYKQFKKWADDEKTHSVTKLVTNFFIGKQAPASVSFVDLVFPNELISLLRRKLKLIQQLCSESLVNDSALTPNDLFNELQPDLARLYRKAKQNKKDITPFEHFVQIDKMSTYVGIVVIDPVKKKQENLNNESKEQEQFYYQPAISSIAAVKAPFNRLKKIVTNPTMPDTLTKYYKLIQYISPAQARQQLSEMIKIGRELDRLIELFNTQNIILLDKYTLNRGIKFAPSIWLEFIDRLSFTKIKSDVKQRVMIDNLKKSLKLIQHRQIEISRFNISHCKVLTDDDLLDILKPFGRHLIYLNISDCDQLTNNSLSYIGTLCPNLRVLKARNLSKLSSLDMLYKKNTNAFILQWESEKNELALEALYVNGCPKLRLRQIFEWTARLSHIEYGQEGGLGDFKGLWSINKDLLPLLTVKKHGVNKLAVQELLTSSFSTKDKNINEKIISFIVNLTDDLKQHAENNNLRYLFIEKYAPKEKLQAIKFYESKLFTYFLRHIPITFFSDCHEKIKNNKLLFKIAIKKNFDKDQSLLKYASLALKKDNDLFRFVVRKNIQYLNDADNSLKNNAEFMLEMIKLNIHTIEYFSKNLSENENFILKILKMYPSPKDIFFISQFIEINLLKSDKIMQILFDSVKQDGLALYSAHPELKKNKEMVLTAVKQNGNALQYADKTLRKDKAIVLAAIRQNSHALEHAEKALKKDKDIVLIAIKEDGNALQYADEALRKDKAIVLVAIKQNGYAFQYADKVLRQNKSVVLMALKQSFYALKYAAEELKKDKKFMLLAVNQNGNALLYADETLRKNKDIVLAAVKENGYAFYYVAEKLKKDKEFMLLAINKSSYALQYTDKTLRKDEAILLAAVKENPYLFYYVAEKLKKDKKFMLLAIKDDGYALQYADEELRKDKDILLAAVKGNPYIFYYITEELKKDKEFMLLAVKKDGYALQYADEKLKKDKTIVFAAVKQNVNALQYAAEALKKDKEFILLVIKEQGYAIRYIDKELKKHKKFMLLAIKEDGNLLKYADETLRKDKAIVLAAVKQNRNAFQYAAEALKKDRKFILLVVKQNGWLLEYADKTLKQDKAIVLAAVKKNSFALEYAAEELKKDKEFMLLAIKQNSSVFIFVDEMLRKDKKFILLAIEQNSSVFIFVDEMLSKDKTIVLAAVKKNGCLLLFVDETLKKDKAIVLAAVKQNGNVLQYADKTLRQDPVIVLAAVKQNHSSLFYAQEYLIDYDNFPLVTEKEVLSFLLRCTDKELKSKNFINVFKFINFKLQNNSCFIDTLIKTGVSNDGLKRWGASNNILTNIEDAYYKKNFYFQNYFFTPQKNTRQTSTKTIGDNESENLSLAINL